MDILSLGLGTKRGQKIKIVNVTLGTVPLDDGRTETKLVLVCKTMAGQTRNIDEVWLRDYKKSLKLSGLWVTLDDDNAISEMSALGKFLKFVNVKSIKELIGKEVLAYPKDNGFLAVAAVDMDSGEVSS